MMKDVGFKRESNENILSVGIVRTSVIVTGVQVCSRIFMVWFIASSIRQVRRNALLYLVSIYTWLYVIRYIYFIIKRMYQISYCPHQTCDCG